MAVHSTTASLLKESLTEFVRAAEFCVAYRKDDKWGQAQVGGILGYPAVALLFCVADSIGSYHRGKPGFVVLVDGKNVPITNASHHHFYIFNSEYYGLALTESSIKKLHKNYRSLLLHNSALAMNHVLFCGDQADPPFILDSSKIHVNVPAFLRVSQASLLKFLQVIDSVVPGSEQDKLIGLKK